MHITAKDLALIISFAALYAVLSLVSLFPVLGALGTFITLASIMAPILGIMLGPYLGASAASIGGFIGWSITQTGAFSFLSFVPGACTAFASGLLARGKRVESAALYLTLFMLLAFYPIIGPVWLYPLYLWFQLIGLIILASPLTPAAVAFTRKNNNFARLSLGVCVVSLVSTLFGQMAGNFMFEIARWQTVPQVEFWRTTLWQSLTVVYPVERLLITAVATVVGAPVIKAIEANGFRIGGEQKNATAPDTH